MPVAPPTTAIGRCPAFLKPPQHQQAHQTADVQTVGRRIEAGVQGPRLLGEPSVHAGIVGRLMNQATPAEIGEEETWEMLDVKCEIADVRTKQAT